MRKLTYFGLIGGLIALGACTTVLDERTETITLDGQQYQMVTRKLQSSVGNEEPYYSTKVKVGARRVNCNPHIEGQCARAVRDAKYSGSFGENRFENFFGNYRLPSNQN